MRGPGESREYRYPPILLAAGGWSQLSFALLAGAVVAPYDYQWWDGGGDYRHGVKGYLDLSDMSWIRFDLDGERSPKAAPGDCGTRSKCSTSSGAGLALRIGSASVSPYTLTAATNFGWMNRSPSIAGR